MVGNNAAVLYDRVSVQGYEECQDDILAVSEMAEDIRDAFLEYQVRGETFRAAIVLLRVRRSNRLSSNGRYTNKIAD